MISVNISVLISVYKSEYPEYFDRALVSIWDDQLVKPDEIVLVIDGPIGSDLEEVINKWKIKLSKKLITVKLEKNVGLGNALAHGLKKCKSNYIARMDSDDISIPERFKLQKEYIQQNPNIDCLGSSVREFHKNLIFTGERKVPRKDSDIKKFSKYRNPINHPTVIFKKLSVIESGGIRECHGFEDYYLWIRMIKNNCKFHNLQKNLVLMRSGVGQTKRRRGLDYFKKELIFLKKALAIKHINYFDFVNIMLIRAPVRLLPLWFANILYKLIRGVS